MSTCHKRLLWHLGLYITYQASLSLGLPKQKYWNRLPFPSPWRRYPPREKISTQELSSRPLHCRQILYCWATRWSILKSRNITLPTKFHIVKAMVFLAVMYGCKNWTTKKDDRWRIDAFKWWCWREDSWSPLDCKEIRRVHSKGNQPWIFIGRTDSGAEAPILWPPDEKSQFIGEDLDAEKEWRQKEKGVAENEMVGWSWVWAN